MYKPDVPYIDTRYVVFTDDHDAVFTLKDFANRSEHIELAEWNDGNVYIRIGNGIHITPFAGFDAPAVSK